LLRLLLDTHAILWWWRDDARLAARTRAVIGDRLNDVYVSSVSGLEIATKVRIGKLPIMREPIRRYDELVRDWGFLHLAVDQNHAVHAGLLDGSHRDPFDRLIAAQGLLEGLTIVTRDKEFTIFGCETLW